MERLNRNRAACTGFTLMLALAGAKGSVAAHQADVGVRPGREPEIIRTILLRKAACDRVQPGFRDLSANAFGRWRRFGTQTIDAIEQSPEFKARLADVGRLPANAPGAQDRRDADAFCGDDFIGRIEALGRDPDPRLATPDGTWRTFVAALQAGDLTTVLAVMTETARDKQRGRFEKQPAQVLRETGDAFVRFELKAPLGPYRVGVATRNDGQTVTVFFEQSWNGDWRIATI